MTSLEKHRYLDTSKYSGVAVHNNVYTFPLWNLSGQMLGYQQYRPDADKTRKANPKEMRYYTYLPKTTNTAWGLETLDSNKNYLLLVEGVFDAVNLHNEGFNALAVLTNNPVPLRSWLRTLGYATIVSVCEGDTAGRKLASVGDKAIYLPEGTDVGDMKPHEINETFKEYK